MNAVALSDTADICEHCEQVIDTAKHHMCSMPRELRRRRKYGIGAGEPLRVNPIPGDVDTPEDIEVAYELEDDDL